MPKNQRLTHSVAESVMLNANLKPLEPYTNAHTKWKCECLVCGTIVFPKYATVQSKGAGCKTCRYAKIREHHVLPFEEIVSEIEKRGGKLISSDYVNVDTPLKIQCSLSHDFEMRFSHVRRGQWCPTCNKGSKSEEIARTTFEQIFKQKFPKKRPKWLKNGRGFQMELDGYCEDLAIGFEYQGIQHFSLPLFNSDVGQRIKDDKLKAKLCAEKGVRLFILTYEMEYADFPSQIAHQAKSFGIEMPKDWEDMTIDVYQAYIRDDRIEELRQLLAKRLIEVLSPKYLGSNEYLELRCLRCRHTWKAKGNAYFNTRRTAGCDKCARRRAGLINRLSIEDLKNYAKTYSGELISKQYVKRNYWYQWRCSMGHEFDGNFNNMVFRKQFCPICENRNTRKRKKEK